MGNRIKNMKFKISFVKTLLSIIYFLRANLIEEVLKFPEEAFNAIHRIPVNRIGKG
jgi:hypothetical protein